MILSAHHVKMHVFTMQSSWNYPDDGTQEIDQPKRMQMPMPTQKKNINHLKED
jgi:hypothetical protein